MGIGCISQTLQVRFVCGQSGLLVIRGPRAHVELVRSAVTAVTEVAGEPIAIDVHQVCGSLRTVTAQATRWIRRFLVDSDTAPEAAASASQALRVALEP